MRRAHGHTRAGVALGGQSPWWLLGACWSACADSRRRSGARCDTLFECNQSAPSDRVSNRYWKPEELCAGMTGAYLRQAASQRPSGMHCIAENRVMREVDCRGCLRLEYSLNFSCLYYTSILVLPLHWKGRRRGKTSQQDCFLDDRSFLSGPAEKDSRFLYPIICLDLLKLL